MIQIPIYPIQRTTADFSFEIELNVQLVSFRIQWNSRTEFFHMNFTDPDGFEITSLKMIQNWPLLDLHQASLNFLGDLLILKEDESLGDVIGYEDLGNGYNLYYLTEEEFSSWEAANGF